MQRLDEEDLDHIRRTGGRWEYDDDGDVIVNDAEDSVENGVLIAVDKTLLRSRLAWKDADLQETKRRSIVSEKPPEPVDRGEVAQARCRVARALLWRPPNSPRWPRRPAPSTSRSRSAVIVLARPSRRVRCLILLPSGSAFTTTCSAQTPRGQIPKHATTTSTPCDGLRGHCRGRRSHPTHRALPSMTCTPGWWTPVTLSATSGVGHHTRTSR